MEPALLVRLFSRNVLVYSSRINICMCGFGFRYDVYMIEVLYIAFLAAIYSHNKRGPLLISSKLENEEVYMLSKILILPSALNFEFRQILYMTFLNAADSCDKKYSM